jgi:hypothetical protein
LRMPFMTTGSEVGSNVDLREGVSQVFVLIAKDSAAF